MNTTWVVHPAVIGHLRAALQKFDADLQDELIECPVCGRFGRLDGFEHTTVQANPCLTFCPVI